MTWSRLRDSAVGYGDLAMVLDHAIIVAPDIDIGENCRVVIAGTLRTKSSAHCHCSWVVL